MSSFFEGAETIVIWSNVTATVATTQLLSAALMAGFKGVVRIDSALMKMPGLLKDAVEVPTKKKFKPQKDKEYSSPAKVVKYKYRDSLYEVTFFNTKDSLENVVRGADLLLDIEVAASDGGKFDAYNDSYDMAVPVIVKKLDALNIRYVLPIKMYAEIDRVLLIGEEHLVRTVRYVYTGAQFSNLMCYLTNVEIQSWQDYDLNTFDGRAKWFAATILVNIARNTYNLTGLTPNFLLEDNKFPIIKIKAGGMGHITSNVHTYSYIYKERVEAYSMDELLETIESSGDSALVAGAQNEFYERVRQQSSASQEARDEEIEEDNSKGKEQEGGGEGSSSTVPTPKQPRVETFF